MPPGRVRYLSLILFAISFWLMVDLGRWELSFGELALGLLFYSAASLIVLNQRYLVTENLSTPLLLLNLAIATRYLSKRTGETSLAFWTVGLCAAAILTKVVAGVQAGVIVALLLAQGRRREIAYPLIGAAVGLALYVIYGWWQDWEVFRTVLADQAARFWGFEAMSGLMFLDTGQPETRDFLIFLGWLALIFESLAPRRRTIFLAPWVYLLGFIFFTSAPAIYSWHFLPFAPFLSLALGCLIYRLWQSSHPVAILAAAAILLPHAFHTLFENRPEWGPLFRWLYLLVTAVLLAVVFSGRQSATRLWKAILTIAIALLILENLWRVWLA
ncbi:hypothetical protein HQ520_09125 [bacterium]|nr:hypothetical protein [bacterium]